MKYSIIAGTSQALTGAHRDCEGQKAADGERDVDKVEHEPNPFHGYRPEKWRYRA
ncbi:hypothetical protein [Ensifer sp. LCM 4579]|uniref:hypothetical protein n=1 Tax=Ensifer sp. LCM 4579 TaxID=1848292 RepID=UPI00155F2F9B|nr:hypothetical protein [Ensifer sp. LCM 4579]